jgi:hypothetical protein
MDTVLLKRLESLFLGGGVKFCGLITFPRKPIVVLIMSYKNSVQIFISLFPRSASIFYTSPHLGPQNDYMCGFQNTVLHAFLNYCARATLPFIFFSAPI